MFRISGHLLTSPEVFDAQTSKGFSSCRQSTGRSWRQLPFFPSFQGHREPLAGTQEQLGRPPILKQNLCPLALALVISESLGSGRAFIPHSVNVPPKQGAGSNLLAKRSSANRALLLLLLPLRPSRPLRLICCQLLYRARVYPYHTRHPKPLSSLTDSGGSGRD